MTCATSTKPWGKRRATVALVLLALALTLLARTPADAKAAQLGISALASSSASPPSFVPNWDGHTDSTVIEYRVIARSSVEVVLIDASGRIHARLDRGIRDAGTHTTWWDGRDSHGNVLPPGNYRVRVVAKPLGPATAPAPVPGEPGSANAGGGAAVTGTTDVPVSLEAPAVAIRSVRLSRGAVGRSRANASTRATFDLTVPASVSAAIVDNAGRVMRTLHAGRLRAGRQALTWNGRGGNGAPVGDGQYALLVAATGGGKPTVTLRVPLRVDRTTPKVSATKRVRAGVTSRAVAIPVKVGLSEASSLRFALGKRSITVDKPAGSHAFTLRAAALGIVPRTAARSYRIALTVSDATGNARRMVIVAIVPAVRAPKPAPPTRNPSTGNPSQGPPVATGRLRWPVDGQLTSPFGMRNGRPHTGIDVAAPTGTPIVPAAAGVVSHAGAMDGYGNLVIVDHANGMQTYYAHLSRFGGYVVGDRVSGLNEIGYVGCTGNCTGPHLHFEVRIGGRPMDPKAYLASS